MKKEMAKARSLPGIATLDLMAKARSLPGIATLDPRDSAADEDSK